jgi:predicted  nucleic acid-binding Zn-ribbon protein
MRIHAPFIVFCALLLACNGEKRRLQERFSALERQHATLSQRLEGRRSTLSDEVQRIDTLKADLTAYNTSVHTFIAGHRIAAECIRASRSTWGETNAFSHDVSTATRFGTALCAVALLNAEFAQEVARVADRLGEADAHARDLQSQIAAAERAIEAGRAGVQQGEAAVDQLAAEIADVQRQLER